MDRHLSDSRQALIQLADASHTLCALVFRWAETPTSPGDLQCTTSEMMMTRRDGREHGSGNSRQTNDHDGSECS